ncbi:tetratricopeptide repeat protein [Clostridium sp. Marseille-Q2269]|uniref:tetratricopeptide repeat protein n=1 Tax=Clostridium sp. Marseille-Q2269 TaxID=2942205 RepID=UPI00207493AF|nr:tetratricopeptide repeat protein [Clostridium sp. Marseille-Q2269]
MNKEAKSRKIYTQALNSFNDGKIDKALDLCEKSISMDLKNGSAINLKGLLYYLKGDLISCKNLWKINCNTNKNTVSQKYLQDIQYDEQFLKKYANSISLIKNNDIEGAIDLLKQCEKTDFNSINVCNNLAMCYIKLGKYNNALQYYEKVLARDKNNKLCLKIKKQLCKNGLIKNNIGKKILVAVLIIAIISSVSVYLFIRSNNIKEVHKINNNKISSKNHTNKTSTPKKEPVKKPNIKKEEKMNVQELNNFIDKKNFVELYNIYSNYKDKNLDVNSKSVLIKAEKFLKEEGIEYFYNTAMENANNKKYKESNEFLLKAYSFGNINYLYPHIIYLLATNYEGLNNISECLKYYEIYANKFTNSDYGDLALYKLAILNEKIDDNKSRNYAEKLSETYPESMYNNSNINRILNKQ